MTDTAEPTSATPNAPAATATAPAANATAPAANATGPAATATAPAANATAPATNATGPATNATGPATNGAAPGADGSGPAAKDASDAAETAAPLFDAERRATELAILDALRGVVDPEIGMNVVELALIKQILLGENETEVKMILTTPFCPYAGSMIAQVQEQVESVVEHPVKVTLLAERWDPRDAGLMW